MEVMSPLWLVGGAQTHTWIAFETALRTPHLRDRGSIKLNDLQLIDEDDP